jgi:hypothetical protein
MKASISHYQKIENMHIEVDSNGTIKVAPAPKSPHWGYTHLDKSKTQCLTKDHRDYERLRQLHDEVEWFEKKYTPLLKKDSEKVQEEKKYDEKIEAQIKDLQNLLKRVRQDREDADGA